MLAPEKPCEWQFASVLQRCTAHVIDSILALVVILLVAPLLASENLLFMIGGIAGIMAACFYRLLGDALFHGQALGKRLMGIQVVDAEHGRPCSAMQCLFRTGIFVIPFMPLVELILLAIDGQERWGDKVARTYVLRVHAQPAPEPKPMKPVDWQGLREVLEHRETSAKAIR